MTKTIHLHRLQVVKEDHSELYGKPRVQSSRDMLDILRKHFDGLAEEHFLVVHLDAKQSPVGYQVVSIGSLSMSIVHPREVFKLACCMNAAAIICAHNHPSGDPAPSIEDRVLTDRLVRCGDLIGIPVLDHLVVGDDGRYISFADQGWLTDRKGNHETL